MTASSCLSALVRRLLPPPSDLRLSLLWPSLLTALLHLQSCWFPWQTGCRDTTHWTGVEGQSVWQCWWSAQCCSGVWRGPLWRWQRLPSLSQRQEWKGPGRAHLESCGVGCWRTKRRRRSWSMSPGSVAQGLRWPLQSTKPNYYKVNLDLCLALYM